MHTTLTLTESQHSFEDAQKFLDLLAPQSHFTFQTFDDSKAKRTWLAKILHGTLTEHFQELKSLNRQGAGIFVTINETDGKGRKASNITRVRAAFVDLDGAPIEPVLSDPMPPHLVVESSTGKYHAYWMLDFLPLESFKLIQQALAKRFNGDKAVCDLPRVMRLPGFLHQKGAPFQSAIVGADEGRYTSSEFLKAFGIVIPERRMTPEPTRQPSKGEVSWILGECLTQIADAPFGNRNNILNREVFMIGRMVAGGHVSFDDALQQILDAANHHENATYTATRSLQEGIQAGSYRIPAPAPHFAQAEALPPDEAREALKQEIFNIINRAVDWKFRSEEVNDLIAEQGFAKAAANKIVREKHDFDDLIHAPRDLIVATPGLGKTRITIESILECDLALTFFYTPTTTLGKELEAAFPGQIKVIEGRNGSNCQYHEQCQTAGKGGIPVYSTFCEIIMENMAPLVCPAFIDCRYLMQFQPSTAKIVVLSHEYLTIDLSLLKNLGTPDLHVIDESIISILAGSTSIAPNDLPADFRGMQPGDDAKLIAEPRGWTLDDVRDYRDMLFSDMKRECFLAARKFWPGIALDTFYQKLSTIEKTHVPQNWQFFSVLARQWNFDKGVEAIAVRTQPVIVDGKTELQPRVAISFKKDIPAILERKPVLMLDADGDIAINRQLVSTRMVEHKIEASRNVFVIQVSTPCSKMTLGVPRSAATEKLKRMACLIREFLPGEKLVITYQGAEPLADFGRDARVNHFSNFLGQNAYRDLPLAVVLGRNLPPCEDLENLARGIFIDDPEPMALTGRYEQVSQGYLMADGSHRGAKVQAHPAPRVDSLLDIFRGRQSAQAIDRLRLVNDGQKKIAIILDDTPTPIPVDLLVSETGFKLMLAIGKLLRQGCGFVVVDRSAFEAIGFSRGEAEKLWKTMGCGEKTMGCGESSNVPDLHPPILYIYRGVQTWNIRIPTIQVFKRAGRSFVVASILDAEKTEERIKAASNPIWESLDRSQFGVIHLSTRWLTFSYPDIFQSTGAAHRLISEIRPSGYFCCRDARQKTAYLAKPGIDHRAALEKLAEASGRELAFFEQGASNG